MPMTNSGMNANWVAALFAVSGPATVVVRQQMARDRLARALKAISQQCRLMRHWPLREQHQRLCLMLKGLYGYFGILWLSVLLSLPVPLIVHRYS